MKQKPKKVIYENQKEVLSKILKFIKSILDENIKEAYLFGSASRGEFGKYIENYNGHEGSDIDIIVFVRNEKSLGNWKYLNTEKSFWKLYEAGKIEINGILHKVDALVVKDGMEEVARKSDIFKKGVLKIR